MKSSNWNGIAGKLICSRASLKKKIKGPWNSKYINKEHFLSSKFNERSTMLYAKEE